MHETPSLKSTCPFWDIASPTSRIAGDFQRFPSEQRLPRDSCTREGTLLSRHSESLSEGTAMFTRPENFSRLRSAHALETVVIFDTGRRTFFSNSKQLLGGEYRRVSTFSRKGENRGFLYLFRYLKF